MVEPGFEPFDYQTPSTVPCPESVPKGGEASKETLKCTESQGRWTEHMPPAQGSLLLLPHGFFICYKKSAQDMLCAQPGAGGCRLRDEADPVPDGTESPG